MIYAWEKKARKMIAKTVDCVMSDDFRIIGVAVESVETGEGAYIPTVENDGDVILSDVMRDVCFDARKFYDDTIEKRQCFADQLRKSSVMGYR